MTDASIIRRHNRYAVLADSQPVRLRDGTVLDLHRVREHNNPEVCRFLRAVLDHPLIESHVVDVRDLDPARTLDADIRHARPADATDLVVLTLRQLYPDGAALLTKIVEESLDKIPPPGTNDGEITPADARAIAAAMARHSFRNQRRNLGGVDAQA